MYDKDEVGANVPHDLIASIKGAGEGPLKGLTFMVKDLFQVKGHKTGNGSPDFLKHNEESKKTAPLIIKLHGLKSLFTTIKKFVELKLKIL